MKVLIVNNLQSGLRDGSIFEFVRKFSRDSDELIIRNTDGGTPIESLLDGADSCDLVIAAGGDGSIAAVCYALRYTGIPILPFPAGTGNLMVTNLDQPEEPYALVEMAHSLRTLDFDLGEIDFEGDGNRGPTTRGFAVIAGAGYDATIMENAERLKELLGPGAYIAAAVANPAPTTARFNIQLDEQSVECEGIAALVLNFSKIYPDISITHANDARDGLLEVAVLKPHNAVELLPAFFAAFLDRSGGFPHRADAIQTFRAKSVRIDSTPPLILQYDGEIPGCRTPFSARVLPGATRLIVTEQEYRRLTEE
ncbi:MAG: NAD(+)/NADH kinase [Coriobacteriales bacterium]|jgi:diacylglycerol kinase family enzyme|nr:NAD(+)/NADH kinase [Coriobacteriales bacterium]